MHNRYFRRRAFIVLALTLIFLLFNFLPSFSQPVGGLGKITDSAFTPLPAMGIGKGAASVGLMYFDVDGDGKADLVGEAGVVFRNIGTPKVPAFEPWNGHLSVLFPMGKGAAFGDLDGDGRQDVVILSGGDEYGVGDSTISIFRNISTPGHIAFDTAIVMPLHFYPGFVHTADCDHDGKPELLIEGLYSGITIFRNTSSAGVFSFMPTVFYPDVLVACYDLNGDGLPEMVDGARLTYRIRVSPYTGIPVRCLPLASSPQSYSGLRIASCSLVPKRG
jgi:hypothetical protein